ncbi:hypothetical protein QU487_21780 [Crenobacter sp. SG2305]|nr:hypothetical protein [Crenobacter sp. SG2305]MDN0085335.1 hypothetical protein [Crenobacter sp. SG2305]
MSRKQRGVVVESLNALDGDTPRVLLATSKLVGEGFDHPQLDTMVLAMPISWKDTLQQYAERLHREHTTKTNVLIIIRQPAVAQLGTSAGLPCGDR